MPYRAISVRPTDRWLAGLSTDVKPAIDPTLAGHKLLETDTGNSFAWSGTSWYQTHSAGQPILASQPYGAQQLYHMSTPKLTLPANGDYSFSMATAATESIIFKSIVVQSAAGETTIELHEAVSTVTGGTTVVPENLDRQTGAAFPAIYTEGITAWTGGTSIFTGVMLNNSNKSEFIGEEHLLNFRLKKSNLYTLHIHNAETSARDIAVSFHVATTPT